MTTRNLQARILFEGGWATDFGPTSHVAIGRDGSLRVPFLVNAEDAMYDLDGGPRKIGGTERVNSSALNSGATIRGLTDFWVLGTGSSFTQHIVVHVGDELMKDDADGSFTSIRPSARDTSAVPNYATYDDDLIIMSDANGEVPLRWTGSGNASVLGTNTPDCAFGVTHKNRFWMAGNQAVKSRLYFSEPLPNGANGDWNAVEAGFIDIDPNDGDEIRGIISHKNILWVFKGPNIGSIHMIRGDTPLDGVTVSTAATRPVPFTKDVFVRGLGAAGQNSIFRFGDDIGFIDAKTGSIRSLNATERFGDFREAALSFPINSFLLERLNKTRLKGSWAAHDVARSGVGFTVAVDTSTTNNAVLWMDYRFDPPRWAYWPAIVAESMATVVDASNNNRQSVYIGDTSGFVRRTQIANKSIDATTAINYKVTLPHLDFGNPVTKKTLARAGVGIEPKGDYNATFGWARDNLAQQTTTFDQGGGDVLAGAGSFSAPIVTSVQNGTDVTFGTGLFAHGLSAGDSVVLFWESAPGSGYNGTYTVSNVVNLVKFEVTVDFIAGAGSGRFSRASEANFFTLGLSTLSGARFVDRFFSTEEGGEFRSIQLEVSQNGLNEDAAIHSIFAEMEIGADSTEN